MISSVSIRKVSGAMVNMSELDGNSLLQMHNAGMSLRAISYQVRADYKTVKKALVMLGVKF